MRHPQIDAAAALCFPCFQIFRRYSDCIPAVTETIPVHMSSAFLRTRKHLQMIEPLSGQILRTAPSAPRRFRNASAVFDRTALQILCVCKDLSAAVTFAAPYDLTAKSLFCFFFYRQVSEAPSCQVFTSSCHVLAYASSSFFLFRMIPVAEPAIAAASIIRMYSI